MKSYRICSCTAFISGGKRLRRPRKEFFTDFLRENFLNDVKQYLKNHYYNVGTILDVITSDELTLMTII